MPFLAALPAWASTAIGLGSSLGGSFLGQKAAGGGRPPEMDPEIKANLLRSGNLAYGLVNQYTPGMIQAGTQRAGTAYDVGMGLLGQAGANYAPAVSYYKSLLSGDRPTLLQSLSPEIGQINQGYNTLLQSGTELDRRGGGSSAMQAELPYKRMTDINTLLFGARPQGAAGLAGIAGQQGQLGIGGLGASRDFMNAGVNALSAGTQGLYASTAANQAIAQNQLGLLTAGLEKRRQNVGMLSDIGSGLFGLLKQLGLFGGGTKGPYSV